MSSEDVIELGSSDDEAAPAPKKRKHIPNAMVHIPGKKQFANVKNFQSRQATKFSPILPQINKFPNKQIITLPIGNPSVSIKKNVTKVKPPQVAGHKIVTKTFKVNPMKNNPMNINPMNPMNINTHKLNLVHKSSVINQSPKFKIIPKPGVTKGPDNKYLTKLPPGITVTKTGGPAPKTQVINRRIIGTAPITIQNKSNPSKSIQNPQAQKVFNPAVNKKNENVVKMVPITVELDDEEETTHASSPQWYLEPEDEKTSINENDDNKIEHVTKEEENNEEPFKSFVEITIEDSPVKPVKKQSETSKEMAITVDDSPVKLPNINEQAKQISDEEKHSKTNQPPSKKKLMYPENVMIEINIDGEINNDTHVESNTNVREGAKTPPKIIETETPCIENQVITLEDTPQKTEAENFAFKKIVLPVLLAKAPDNTINKAKSPEPAEPTVNEDLNHPNNKDPNIPSNKMLTEDSEFHPEYQKFIDLCFELENSDDMKKIVEKKIKAYYRQVPKEYTESEGFIEIVSTKIAAMRASPDAMYLHIKDVVDELNLQRKIAKAQLENKEKEMEESSSVVVEDGDPKRRHQIKKLEKTLKKLHRSIQKMEEQEVDFDDEADSVYLLVDRYKERLMKVHKKLCQLTNTKMPSEPRIHIETRPGRPLGPARCLEKFVNKKVPVGTPLPFPDFHDVVRCVKEANKEDNLNWTDFEIMDEARDLFVRCGKKLKRRRQENEWRLASSRLPANKDPAEESVDLKKKLEENKSTADEKESEVINKYADRQNQLKLEPVEITDKEADESPNESDDEVQEVPNPSNISDYAASPADSPRSYVATKQTEDKTSNKDSVESLNINESNDRTSKNIVSDKDSVESLDKKSIGNTEDTDQTLKERNLNKVNIDIDEKSNNENAPKNIENKDNMSDLEEQENIADVITVKRKSIEKNEDDSVNEISDDERDELNLLEEINFDIAEKSSSLESLSESDDDSAIAISDSIESAEDGHPSSDVESIALSSSDEESLNTSTETVKTVIENTEIEETFPYSENPKSLDTDEALGFNENDSVDENMSNLNSPNFINLRDDSLTIDETIIAASNADTFVLGKDNENEMEISENTVVLNSDEEKSNNSVINNDDTTNSEAASKTKFVLCKKNEMEISENTVVLNSDEEKSNNSVINNDDTTNTEVLSNDNEYETEESENSVVLNSDDEKSNNSVITNDDTTNTEVVNKFVLCNDEQKTESPINTVVLNSDDEKSNNEVIENDGIANFEVVINEELDPADVNNDNKSKVERLKKHDYSEDSSIDSITNVESKSIVDSEEDEINEEYNKFNLSSEAMEVDSEKTVFNSECTEIMDVDDDVQDETENPCPLEKELNTNVSHENNPNDNEIIDKIKLNEETKQSEISNNVAKTKEQMEV